nr:MAG TPA: hypothetical protein [Caudoviricetes sp.]
MPLGSVLRSLGRPSVPRLHPRGGRAFSGRIHAR